MIKSPCISICKNKEGICQGCGRTLYEIKMWTSFSNDVKLEIREQSERRKANFNLDSRIKEKD